MSDGIALRGTARNMVVTEKTMTYELLVKQRMRYEAKGKCESCNHYRNETHETVFLQSFDELDVSALGRFLNETKV